MSRAWLSGRTDFNSNSKESLTNKTPHFAQSHGKKHVTFPLHFPTIFNLLCTVGFLQEAYIRLSFH